MLLSARATREMAASALLFAALGDETRLRLIGRLCHEGPLSIMRLSSGEAITRQAVTKHLRVMERAGLLQSAKDGREIVWQLDPRQLEYAKRYVDLVLQRWDGALQRLRAFVEE